MKKWIAMLLVLTMTLSLAACGASGEPTQPAEQATEATAAAQPKDTDKLNSMGSILVGVDEDVEVNTSDVHMDAAEANAAGKWEALFTPIEMEGRALDMADFDLTPTAEELEAMKAEPAYGKSNVYFMTGGCSAGITVADLLGYFDEVGIEVEGVKGQSDVEAVGSGQAVAAIGHIASMMVPITNGVDLTFVSGAHFGCKSLYVLGSSDYKTIQDLKGTSISIPEGIGFADYNIASMLLDDNGIDPQKDVDLIQVTSDACVAAMEKGEISAAILSDFFAYGMVKDGTLRCVSSMFDSTFSEVGMCCVMAMNGEFIRQNPVHAKKFVQCVQKALCWMRENVEEATQLMADNGLNNGNIEMNVMLNNALQFGPTNEITEANLKEVISRYLRLGLITSMDDADEIMERVWTPLAG